MSGYSICIIGVTSEQGKTLLEKLASTGLHQLLLIDKDAEKTNSLLSDILNCYPNTAIERLDCMKDASWEADIIAIAATDDIRELSEKIKDVVNKKIILRLTEQIIEHIGEGIPLFSEYTGNDDWETFFPQARVVKVFIGSLASYVTSTDQDALGTITALLTETGFNPFPELKQTSNINISTK